MFTVYLACLVAGLVATVLFALLGGLSGHAGGHIAIGGHAGGHVVAAGAGHAVAHTATAHGLTHGASHTAVGNASSHGVHGGHGHTASHTDAAARIAQQNWLASSIGWALSWLSPLTLAAAALWFGGAGLIFQSILPRGASGLALPVAVVAGILGAGVVRALMAALVRSSTAPLSGSADGAIGTLSAAIRPDAAGEVIYTMEGLRRSLPARSADGMPLPRGTDVVIVRRERGIAWVSPLDPLAGLGRVAAGSDDGKAAPSVHNDHSPPP